ncbi:hypothetical protein EMIT0180MI3_360049 [Priestia megaterium]
MALQHAHGQRHVLRVGAEDADDRLVLWRGGFHRRQFVEAHGRTVVDHEVIAAVGFDHVTERGEGFFGQRFNRQCAHAGLLNLECVGVLLL